MWLEHKKEYHATRCEENGFYEHKHVRCEMENKPVILDISGWHAEFSLIC